jgi:hypothetical protein
MVEIMDVCLVPAVSLTAASLTYNRNAYMINTYKAQVTGLLSHVLCWRTRSYMVFSKKTIISFVCASQAGRT